MFSHWIMNGWTDLMRRRVVVVVVVVVFHPHFLSSSFFDPSAYLPGKKKGRRIYHIKVRDMALYGV